MILIDQEFKSLIPRLSDKEFSQLEENIISDGCRDPLVIWKNQNILIDGHNRHQICINHGIEFNVIEYEFLDRDSVKLWIIQNQFGRRNISDFVRAELALQAEPLIAAKAKERQGTRNDLNIPANLPESKETRDELSAMSGVSARNISKVKNILETGSDELVEQVRSNHISINAAEVIAELSKEDQSEIIAKGEKEILAAAKQIRTEKALIKRQEIAEIKKNNPVLVPEGKYSCIVIDPPWEMKKIARDVAPDQVEFDYPTMSEDELKEFGVRDMAADDCHLFCWTTHKHLPMSLRLIESWGFRYVCTFVWHKNGGFQPFGLPQYNCEFAIYARKGTPEFIDTKAFNCCFSASRREHSRKPDEFYETVARVTEGPRIDVFSREKREGFNQFGNEPDRFVA